MENNASEYDGGRDLRILAVAEFWNLSLLEDIP
jgi:hypothetical protein